MKINFRFNKGCFSSFNDILFVNVSTQAFNTKFYSFLFLVAAFNNLIMKSILLKKKSWCQVGPWCYTGTVYITVTLLPQTQLYLVITLLVISLVCYVYFDWIFYQIYNKYVQNRSFTMTHTKNSDFLSITSRTQLQAARVFLS